MPASNGDAKRQECPFPFLRPRGRLHPEMQSLSLSSPPLSLSALVPPQAMVGRRRAAIGTNGDPAKNRQSEGKVASPPGPPFVWRSGSAKALLVSLLIYQLPFNLASIVAQRSHCASRMSRCGDYSDKRSRETRSPQRLEFNGVETSLPLLICPW